jgi:dTDP-4-dehydrorhamnose 3,5-epimerase
MKVNQASLSGLLIIEPNIYLDNRGHFFEVFQANRFAEYGIPPFVQDNTSHSKGNVLRGLHYQLPHPQGKLVWVSRGAIWDVVVDIRLHSPTFGEWFAITLSDENHLQFYIPPGFAHGFCVLSPDADFHYKCTDYYNPKDEHGVAWNDKQLNIPWPVKHPILSAKDESYPKLHEIKHEHLFT